MSLLTLRVLFERLKAPSQSQKGHFSKNTAQEMTPKLLALARVCSVLGDICDVSWHLSKRGSELEKRLTFSFLNKNGAHKNKAWLKAQLEEHQWSTAAAATTHAAAGGGGASLLRKTQLKLASVKAQRNTLMSAETKAFEDLSVVRSQLREREESLDRLRAKSKTLLSRSVIKCF